MNEKGFINPNTPIMADKPAEPYIRDEGGITDVVSEHIADIIADRAEEVFAKEDTRKGVNGITELITTIDIDDETLEYIIDNIKYDKLFIKFITNVGVSRETRCNLYLNDILCIDFARVFSTSDNQMNAIWTERFGDYIVAMRGALNAPTVASSVYARFDTPFVTPIPLINKITISLSDPSAGNSIEIWGVK